MCLNLFCTLSGIELFVIIREFGIRKTHSHVDMNTLVQARRSVIQDLIREPVVCRNVGCMRVLSFCPESSSG